MTTKKIIIDSTEMSNTLSSYAKKLKESGVLREQLASALIYAGLAEYFCDEFIKALIDQLNLKNQKGSVNLKSKIVYKNENTNLEYALIKLKYIEYPDKNEIEEIIKIIKDARNNLFHNLIRAGEKKINLSIEIIKIQDYTPLLRDRLAQSLIKTL